MLGQVTSDIAQALRTPTPQAEEIKQKHGCALSQFTRKDETIEVQGVGGRPPVELSRPALADIIQPRYAILIWLRLKFKESYQDKITAGLY